MLRTVFVVMYNADRTEGRGPMLIDSVWDSYNSAKDYIRTKKGIMGRPVFYWNQVSKREESTGDWEIKQIDFNTPTKN